MEGRMAEFKKIPKSDSGAGPFDDITAEMAWHFAATYWPVILGGITLFVLILRGNERAAIPVGAAMVLLQAWRWGLFG
jgi:hypothetical protein